jgi:hypothetical protein
MTAKIEGFRRILGDSIYGEILWRVSRARRANAIPNAQLQSDASDAMERAARGIRKAHSLSEEIGDTQFVSVRSSDWSRRLRSLRHAPQRKPQPGGWQGCRPPGAGG